MERQIAFRASLGEEDIEVLLSEQKGGHSWHIYIQKRVCGRIIRHDTGWRVYLDGDQFDQGDADQLLEVIGVPASEMDHKKGYRNPLWPDWYIKELDMLGL